MKYNFQLLVTYIQNNNNKVWIVNVIASWFVPLVKCQQHTYYSLVKLEENNKNRIWKCTIQRQQHPLFSHPSIMCSKNKLASTYSRLHIDTTPNAPDRRCLTDCPSTSSFHSWLFFPFILICTARLICCEKTSNNRVFFFLILILEEIWNLDPYDER